MSLEGTIEYRSWHDPAQRATIVRGLLGIRAEQCLTDEQLLRTSDPDSLVQTAKEIILKDIEFTIQELAKKCANGSFATGSGTSVSVPAIETGAAPVVPASVEGEFSLSFDPTPTDDPYYPNGSWYCYAEPGYEGVGPYPDVAMANCIRAMSKALRNQS